MVTGDSEAAAADRIIIKIMAVLQKALLMVWLTLAAMLQTESEHCGIPEPEVKRITGGKKNGYK